MWRIKIKRIRTKMAAVKTIFVLRPHFSLHIHFGRCFLLIIFTHFFFIIIQHNRFTSECNFKKNRQNYRQARKQETEAKRERRKTKFQYCAVIKQTPTSPNEKVERIFLVPKHSFWHNLSFIIINSITAISDIFLY